MNKVKVRCSVCGKSFKTPSAKKTVCPACDAAVKRAKHQAPAAAATPQPTIVHPTVDVRAAVRAAQENQGQFGAYRPAPPPEATAPAAASSETATLHVNGRQPGQTAPASRPERPARPAARPKAQRTGDKQPAPRPVKERKPRVQMKPFEPTEEQVAAVRTRYLELAQPEFDGIRHQIATEVGIPLRAVKDIIKQLRAEQQIPSWWDRGANMPTPEQIEQIRTLYLPLLPDPEVGVHKRIAAQLQLSNTSVYQAIGQIRADLNLPRYTPRPEEVETGPEAQDAQEDVQEEMRMPMASGE